jgi:O-antigen ligase
LEIALETGLPGVVLVLLFLAWLVRFAWNRWNEPQGDPFAQAATIASAAILAHSLVDFPLRTSAMAGVFAVAIALIAQSRLRVVARTESDLWPTRHVEIR